MSGKINFFHRPKTPNPPVRHQAGVNSTYFTDIEGNSAKTRQATGLAGDARNDSLSQCQEKPLPKVPHSSYSDPTSEPSQAVRELCKAYDRPLKVIEAVHGTIIADLAKPIPVTFNGDLCLVFESYRDLLESNMQRIMREEENRQAWTAAKVKHQEDLRQSRRAEEDYKKEIKRLETIIANSNHGIEGLITARHNSIIRQRKEVERAEQVELQQSLSDEEDLYNFLSESRRDDVSPSRLDVADSRLAARNMDSVLRKEETSVIAIAGDQAATSIRMDAITTTLLNSGVRDPLNVQSSLTFRHEASRVDRSENDSFAPRSRPVVATRTHSQPSTERFAATDSVKVKGTSAGVSIGNALSNLVSWHPRKRQHRDLQLSKDDISQTIDARKPFQDPSAWSSTTAEPLTAVRDTFARPISLTQSDEIASEERQADVRRLNLHARSMSVSEVQSLEPLLDTTTSHSRNRFRKRTTRSSSLDSVNPSYLPAKTVELQHRTSISPARDDSGETVATATNKPRDNKAPNLKSDEPHTSHEASTSESQGILRLPAQGSTPRRRQTVLRSGHASTEQNRIRKVTPAVAAAARATAKASDETSKKSVGLVSGTEKGPGKKAETVKNKHKQNSGRKA